MAGAAARSGIEGLARFERLARFEGLAGFEGLAARSSPWRQLPAGGLLVP
jgi:hypothetical protein